jgi:hypothetical protein
VPREYTTATFSHDDQELIDRAKAKAKRKRMSFSAYVMSLIEADLAESAAETSSSADRAKLLRQRVLGAAVRKTARKNQQQPPS